MNHDASIGSGPFGRSTVALTNAVWDACNGLYSGNDAASPVEKPTLAQASAPESVARRVARFAASSVGPTPRECFVDILGGREDYTRDSVAAIPLDVENLRLRPGGAGQFR